MIALLWIPIVLVVVFLGLPILGMWALNTLFGLSIVFGLKTWLAMVSLMVIFNGRVTDK